MKILNIIAVCYSILLSACQSKTPTPIQDILETPYRYQTEKSTLLYGIVKNKLTFWDKPTFKLEDSTGEMYVWAHKSPEEGEIVYVNGHVKTLVDGFGVKVLVFIED